MEAKLNIWLNCTSEEPTKTFVCRRLLYGASEKIENYSNQFNKLEKKKKDELKKDNPDIDLIKKLEQEQFESNISILKTLFPDFQDDDFKGIDIPEYQAFITEIRKEMQRILTQASKNL